MPTSCTADLVALPEDVERALERCNDLPSLPMVAMKVLDVCKDDQADVRTLAQTIAQDPALVARILKVVNSALFGLPRKIAGIAQAVNLLGIRKTKIVVLGFSVLQTRNKKGDARFDVRRYWARGISTAIAAKLLAAETQVIGPEEAFVAGLLQDIGVLALWRALPDRYGEVLQAYQKSEGQTFYELERTFLSTDHAVVSAWLLHRWKLPDGLVRAVRFHHGRDASGAGTGTDREPSLRAVLELADAISTLIWRDQSGKRELWPDCHALGLSAAVQEEIILEVLRQYREVGEAFSLRENPQISEQELQDAARAELATLALDSLAEAEEQERRQSELQKANRELAHAFQRWERAAKLDRLTGLANRAALEEYLNETLGQASTRPETLGLIMIDVDRFKSVNDTYGHLAGDRALCAVAEAIHDQIRDQCLAARYGGDEFIVLLPNVTLDEVARVAHRIHEAVTNTVVEEGPVRFSVSVSIGIAGSDQFKGEYNYQTLMDAADRSLYDAKRCGRNCIGRPQAE